MEALGGLEPLDIRPSNTIGRGESDAGEKRVQFVCLFKSAEFESLAIIRHIATDSAEGTNEEYYNKIFDRLFECTNVSIDFSFIGKHLFEELERLLCECYGNGWQDEGIAELGALDGQIFDKYISNIFSYMQQVVEDLNHDLEQLSEKFDFGRDNDIQIRMSFVPADPHHHAKMPVKLAIKLAFHSDRSDLTLFYKPRVMYFEQKICDASPTGLFYRLDRANRGMGGGEIFALPFPTYRILACTRDDGSHYGYSESIPGPTLYEEAEDSSGQPYDTRYYFREGEGPLLTAATLEEEIDRNRESPTFFSRRELSENLSLLHSDYLLFYILSRVRAGDVHAANLICFEAGPDLKKEAAQLYPIDLECFDNSTATVDRALLMVEMACRNRSIDVEHLKKAADTLLESCPGCLEDFQKLKERYPCRCIPIDTQVLYDLRSLFMSRVYKEQSLSFSFAEQEGDPPEYKYKEFKSLLTRLQDGGYTVDDDLLAQAMHESFQRFDVPYFDQLGDALFVDGTLVAKKKE